MKPFMITAYFTGGTIYEMEIQRLFLSVIKYDIPFHFHCIESKGTWIKNVNYKPTFLLEMYKKFDCDLVYVDADAEFLKYPVLFDSLDNEIAVHEHDVLQGVHGRHKMEILSGTIFLRHIPRAYNLLREWEDQCQKEPKVWDQKNLQQVLKEPFHRLPPEYCYIEKYMSDVKEPVIYHHQASRIVRKNNGRLQLMNEGVPAPFQKP